MLRSKAIDPVYALRGTEIDVSVRRGGHSDYGLGLSEIHDDLIASYIQSILAQHDPVDVPIYEGAEEEVPSNSAPYWRPR